jgi:hypothetical protein
VIVSWIVERGPHYEPSNNRHAAELPRAKRSRKMRLAEDSVSMTKQLSRLGLTAFLLACAVEKSNGEVGETPASRAGSGGTLSESGAAGKGGVTQAVAGAYERGGTESGGRSATANEAGQTSAGASDEPGAGDAGAASSFAGSPGSAGTAGGGIVCAGGEPCIDYQLPCLPAACTNGHVPYCFCGGGEQALVECHEGGELCP